MVVEFCLYSRQDCGLCMEMHEQLDAMARDYQFRVIEIDIDKDLNLERRFGSRIPVLCCGDDILCHGRLDQDLVGQFLQNRR